MILNRIFRTYTFRFAVLYVLTISVTASVISTLVYLFIANDYFRQVDASLRLELDSAITSFERNGQHGFAEYVLNRTVSGVGDRYYFLLTDADSSTILAGNLDELPVLDQYPGENFSLRKTLFDWYNDHSNRFVGQAVILPGGQKIVAARHYEDVNQRVELVASTLIQSTIVTILLGVIGGTFMSANMIRLIDSLNQSITTIMQGNLSERLPVSQRGGEIDQLAAQLNVMLDRIESSMNDVRQVSDNIAHDLRTPLTRLRNKLSTLEKRASPDNRDMVREMLVEADHLLSICAALLRIAQVESGAKRADFTDVDIARIFVDVVELYEPLAGVKDIALTIESKDSVHIQGDKDLLFQMLANLIDNAIKYTPNGGAIVTQLYVRNEIIHIVFADNGLGVPKEKYEKVFQRFYRVEESRGIQPGNGLGLSLVQAVAVLHGGTVKLSDSRAHFAGHSTPGFTVNVLIPLSATHPA